MAIRVGINEFGRIDAGARKGIITAPAKDEDITIVPGVTDEPLVSSDLKGDPHSSIFSALDTLVIAGDLAKVVAWYDNEWGYSLRVADLVAYVAEKNAS